MDHSISDISSRFIAHSKTAASIQELLPNNITPTSSFVMIEQVVSFYHEDLRNPTIVDEEFCRWKSKWILIPVRERPDTIAKSLKKCPQQSLSNIWTILKLFATLPLSSCERSGSTLKRHSK